MIVREVIPFAQSPIALETSEGRSAIDEIYAPPRSPWVRMNMVTTLTGSASGTDGTSNSITNRVDRAILGAIRGHADAVVVGAQTVRAEGYLLPRGGAALAIVTSSGDIGEELAHQVLRDDALDRVILLVPAHSVERVAARNPALEQCITALPTAKDGHVTPERIVASLAAAGRAGIVCEGGTSLASQFLAAGVVDELCVTVAPIATPTERPFVELTDPLETTVTGMLTDELGFSYLRLRPVR